jgi:hypothetical protein
MTTDLADPVDPVSGSTKEPVMPVEGTVRAAEQLLAARLGAQVVLAEPEDLGGSSKSTVLRVRVARTPFSLPRTLVIKHSATEQLGALGPFAHEAASCQLFTALRREDRPGPELIACDPAQRLLVLEDLGRSGTVANLLQTTDTSAASRVERALLDWSHALGRLHAATRDREPDFAALLRRLGVPHTSDPLADEGRAAIAGIPALLESELGVGTPAEALADAHRAATLLEGRPYRAFSPAGLGPDNAVLGEPVRFIDFEGGGFRSVLLDAAQLRAPLPSSAVALTFPPGMAEAMVSAWHAEVVDSWPELSDRSLLARQLLDGQLVWTWLCTCWLLPLPRPRTPVAAAATSYADLTSVLDRGGVLVDRWERLAAEADAVDCPATSAHAAKVAGALRNRFRVTGEALQRYPVFR